MITGDFGPAPAAALTSCPAAPWLPFPFVAAQRVGLAGHQELPAGQQLGEPDLACVHAPGHGHHDTGQPGRPQPQQPGDQRMAGACC